MKSHHQFLRECHGRCWTRLFGTSSTTSIRSLSFLPNFPAAARRWQPLLVVGLGMAFVANKAMSHRTKVRLDRLNATSGVVIPCKLPPSHVPPTNPSKTLDQTSLPFHYPRCNPKYRKADRVPSFPPALNNMGTRKGSSGLMECPLLPDGVQRKSSSNGICVRPVVTHLC